MNVKKDVSTPRKGQTYQPKTLAHVFVFSNIFSEASTPSLRGPATQHLHDEARNAESATAYMNAHIYSKIHNIMKYLREIRFSMILFGLYINVYVCLAQIL